MARRPASERAGILLNVFFMTTPKKPLTILLASPRGFCAGVDRAIQIVERAIERYGRPVYVRHEIVHNRFVVENLEAKGAIFVDELDEVPDDRPVVFSAHGVPKSVPLEAARRQMIAVDATCPLVTKVHNEAARHHEVGTQMIYIGHEGHAETVGTMGQLPPGEVLLLPYLGFCDYLKKTYGITVEDANQSLLKLRNQNLLHIRKDLAGKQYISFSPKIFEYFNIV